MLAAVSVSLMAGCGSQEPRPRPARPDPAALALQHRLEARELVRLRPNVGAEVRDGKGLGTVIVPLEYRGQWFRLQVNGKNLALDQVVPIRPVHFVHESWDPEHPSVTATTREAIVKVSPIDQEPEAVIHLSNSHQELVAVGQLAANG